MYDGPEPFFHPADFRLEEPVLQEEGVGAFGVLLRRAVAGLPATVEYSPPGWTPTGIRRAPGRKRERKRSQSRASPAGPEMTSYTAATMASTEETSSGSAGTFAPSPTWAVAGGGNPANRKSGRENRIRIRLDRRDARPMGTS